MMWRGAAEVYETTQKLLPEYKPQELANTAYGAARSGRGKCVGALFMALARAAEQGVG